MKITEYLKNPEELAKLEEAWQIAMTYPGLMDKLRTEDPEKELAVSFLGIRRLIWNMRDEYDPGWNAEIEAAADLAWKKYSTSEKFAEDYCLTDDHIQANDARFLGEMNIKLEDKNESTM